MFGVVVVAEYKFNAPDCPLPFFFKSMTPFTHMNTSPPLNSSKKFEALFPSSISRCHTCKRRLKAGVIGEGVIRPRISPGKRGKALFSALCFRHWVVDFPGNTVIMCRRAFDLPIIARALEA